MTIFMWNRLIISGMDNLNAFQNCFKLAVGAKTDKSDLYDIITLVSKHDK